VINDKIAKWVGTLLVHEFSPAEDMPASRKAVFIFLLAYACWNRHKCYPGVDRLARETGYSERTVRECLGDLERWGYIRKTFSGCRGDGKGRGRLANEYEVVVPQELLPARYRTNRQPLPEGRQGLTGNHDGLTGNELHDQPATIAAQDNHKKIDIEQDNGQVSADADASVSFEKEIIQELVKLGVKESHAMMVVREHGPTHAASRLGILQQWQPSADRAPGAFEAAGQILNGQGQDGRPRLPRDDAKLVAFARKHDLSDARPGEEYHEYRNRLNAELQQRAREQ
jgi:hypothetical protein